MSNVTIHANSGISWHNRYAKYFQKGFAKHGIDAAVSGKSHRQSEVAVLFGPNYWKPIERDGGQYLIVNRVLLSTYPRHVHDVVAISWNGLNGRGIFCVDDDPAPGRLELFINPAKDVKPWRSSGEYLLLLGQADLGRCGKYARLAEWYEYVKATVGERVIFRPHPSCGGGNVPLATHFHMARASAVLNSTVAINSILAGVPVMSGDEGNPAHGLAAHSLAEVIRPDRMDFLRYLAHCQWFAHEVESGAFWEQLNPMRGPRLCDFNVPR